MTWCRRRTPLSGRRPRQEVLEKTRGEAYHPSMSTVAEIKSAIERLPLSDRAQLLAELCNWTDDDWDRQMKADAASGKFGALNEQALGDHAEGKTRPLDEILSDK